VQALSSLQSTALPAWQTPFSQLSPVVHALPSLHEAVLLLFTQPKSGLQLSSVQPLPSSQFRAEPPTHEPPAQASPVVQALPSLHGSVLLACTQPLAGLQESSVQALRSSQFGAEPPVQVPSEQASPTVHALPSSHEAVLFSW
jgi:hypothetical protein